MAERFSFTTGRLDALPLPERGQVEYYDTRTVGLLVRVSAKAKVFYLRRRVGAKTVRYKIGPYWQEGRQGLSINHARGVAAELLGRIAQGDNIVATRQREHLLSTTLAEAFDEYLQHRTLKPATAKDYRYDLNLVFGADWRRALKEFTPELVLERHQTYSKRSPAQANRSCRVLRAVLTFARHRYRVDGKAVLLENPVDVLSATKTWNRIDRRKTVIKPHDLRRWFDAVLALPDDFGPNFTGTVRDALLLGIFTGLRRSEIFGLRWADVDARGRLITVRNTKSRRDHTLPIPDNIVALLEHRRADISAFVFPGPDPGKPLNSPHKVIAKVIDASCVEFTLHDLRRTFATIAEALGLGGYAVKALLNHSVDASDVTAGYLVLDHERLREPMARIAAFLLKAAGRE